MAWGFSCFKFQRYEVAVYRVRGVLSYWEIRKRLERRPFCSFPSCHFTFLSDISRFSLTFNVSLWHFMFLSDISCLSDKRPSLKTLYLLYEHFGNTSTLWHFLLVFLHCLRFLKCEKMHISTSKTAYRYFNETKVMHWITFKASSTVNR